MGLKDIGFGYTVMGDHNSEEMLSLYGLSKSRGLKFTFLWLPSYHEGLPIALLEAMSYNLDVLASNIPANMVVNLPLDCYFENKS